MLSLLSVPESNRHYNRLKNKKGTFSTQAARNFNRMDSLKDTNPNEQDGRSVIALAC